MTNTRELNGRKMERTERKDEAARARDITKGCVD